MKNAKMIKIAYIIATILCLGAGVFNFAKGNSSNGLLWLVASCCWVSCVFNINKNNHPNK